MQLHEYILPIDTPSYEFPPLPRTGRPRMILIPVAKLSLSGAVVILPRTLAHIKPVAKGAVLRLMIEAKVPAGRAIHAET